MVKAAQLEEPPSRDVERGDEVYFRSAKGPLCGVVRSRGAHGVTVEVDGKRHPVRWDDLHGHKVRVRPECKVVDQGEDGMIVEEKGGRRRYVHDPMTTEEPEPIAKSLLPVVLFFGEADALAKAATGGKPIMKVHPAAAPPAPPYGVGDEVAFDAGDKALSGKVVGQPGPKGAYVQDADGKLHQVLWSAMRKPTAENDKSEQEAKPAAAEEQPA